jgi:hypothetical protein
MFVNKIQFSHKGERGISYYALEENIQSGNKLGAINEKLFVDTYLSFATTI